MLADGIRRVARRQLVERRTREREAHAVCRAAVIVHAAGPVALVRVHARRARVGEVADVRRDGRTGWGVRAYHRVDRQRRAGSGREARERDVHIVSRRRIRIDSRSGHAEACESHIRRQRVGEP